MDVFYMVCVCAWESTQGRNKKEKAMERKKWLKILHWLSILILFE